MDIKIEQIKTIPIEPKDTKSVLSSLMASQSNSQENNLMLFSGAPQNGSSILRGDTTTLFEPVKSTGHVIPNDDIWTQLLSCSETNVLETRENIIKYFASNAIQVEAIHKFFSLTDCYVFNWCYNEFYYHVVDSKKINFVEVIEKTKKNLKGIYKLEEHFPPNIYKWIEIKKFTQGINPNTELLLSPKVIKGIKQLDQKYDAWVNQICLYLDKLKFKTTLTAEELNELYKELSSINEIRSIFSIYSMTTDNFFDY